MIEAVLCYIDEPWAYFTTQPLIKQWGDDWNDAPYEHNAGRPYEYRDGYDTGPQYQIIKVAFEAGDLETPAGRANSNSSYSVEMINAGAVAWLAPSRWAGSDTKVVIHAGTPLPRFIDLIYEAGGNVYREVER